MINSLNILEIEKIKSFDISSKMLRITNDKDLMYSMEVPDLATALICLQIISINILNNTLKSMKKL